MDYEDLPSVLRNDYDGYFEVRGEQSLPDLFPTFLSTATDRIEYLMQGGYDLEDAYEEYKSEIVSDIQYILKHKAIE